MVDSTELNKNQEAKSTVLFHRKYTINNKNLVYIHQDGVESSERPILFLNQNDVLSFFYAFICKN